MKKQAYLKLMGLNKKAGNVAGPFLLGMAGMAGADQLAQLIHKNPGAVTRALYAIPGTLLGMHAGNKLQNYLQDTNYQAFWDPKDNVERAISAVKKKLEEKEKQKE